MRLWGTLPKGGRVEVKSGSVTVVSQDGTSHVVTDAYDAKAGDAIYIEEGKGLHIWTDSDVFIPFTKREQ